MQELMA
jgi:hypothetical protein